MRIAVVGARGQLGAAIVQECAGHDVVGLTRQQLDITNDHAVADAIARVAPDAVVNCAAYNHVDAAEDHPDDALNHNAFAARTLAAAAERAGAWFVHYGSDFVFDGTASTPYTEDDRPSPRSTYGASKMLGEWFALDVPRSYVLRVESLFGRASGGGPPKGSVAGIMNGLLAGSSPPVFEDRTVSPTYIIDAARATRHLLESGAAPGLYHCVSSGHCTWLDFGRELARLLGVEPRLTPVKVADVTLRARRPQFCALSNEKLRRAGFDMPTWQDALARYIEPRT
ncbi:MAG TPA: dTDP-4-dehydrorhamnose reductase [Vicinamibacterales bacterium]|nr:dTDP-4-dehydrorhamnose reductase [Vicinamibacterales bacterium]